MEEYATKRCTGCGEVKRTSRGFDISPKTGRTFPRCKVCRYISTTVVGQEKVARKLTRHLRLVEHNKRRCVECGLRFIPEILYQKTCDPSCEKLWVSHRKILQESGPREIEVNGHIILLDGDDFEWARLYNWSIQTVKTKPGPIFYAIRHLAGKGRGIFLKMEREILEVDDDLVCDHINHNGLDNRKQNLRVCTQQENLWNKRKSPGCLSNYKGVSWHEGMGKWRGYIANNGKYTHLGFFTSEEEAARAYDAAARERFGEFACLNFPDLELATVG